LVDQDYVNQLSPSEKKWLLEFNASYYGQTFKNGQSHLWSDSERKKAFNSANANRRDVVTMMELGWDHGGRLKREQVLSLLVDFPTPDYLREPQYKKDLEKLRTYFSTDMWEAESQKFNERWQPKHVSKTSSKTN
jgi:hypothetical protein